MFKTPHTPYLFPPKRRRRRRGGKRLAVMKLVWCPETASTAYIDAVKAMAGHDLEETNVAELVSGMAGGWRAQLIVEAWACGDGAATSIGLAAAARHTRGRHVCVMPDERAVAKYAEVMRRSSAVVAEVVVGEAKQVMEEVEGVDFMVVDWRRRDAGRVLREAKPGPRGMVVVCKNAARDEPAWMVGPAKRVVRTAFLPIGGGLEILHVGVGKGPSLGRKRWIKHVDQDTGEEYVCRR